MERTDCYKSVLTDFNSKDVYTDNVCHFISDCLLETLSNPLNVNQFKDEDIKDFIEKKETAEKGIEEDLKNVFKSDVGVTSVGSVFENPALYDVLLDSLSGISLSNKKGNLKVKEANTKIESHLTPKNYIKIDNIKVYDKECSLNSGHIDLDMKLVKKHKLSFGKKMDSFLLTRHCKYNCSKDSPHVIKPIDVSPLTPSKFKITNVNAFLNLSLFCGCCKQRLKESEKLYSLTNSIITLNNQVKFDNTSLFKPFVKRKGNDNHGKTDNSLISVTAKDKSRLDKEVDSKQIVSQPIDILNATVLKPFSDIDKAESNSSMLITSVLSESSATDSPNRIAPDPLSNVIENCTASLSEKSPLIVLGSPDMLKDSEKKTISNIDGKVDDKVKNERCSNETLINKSVSTPLGISPSNKNKENETSKTMLTSKQILDNIYGKYNGNEVQNKKSLREKLDNMIQNDKVKHNKGVKLGLKEVTTGGHGKGTPRKIAMKTNQFSSGELLCNPKSAKPKLSLIEENSIKTKISDVNPIRAPVSSPVSKEKHGDYSKVICDLNSSKTLRKTISNEQNASKLVNEYIPVVTLDTEANEMIPGSLQKRKVILSDDRKKSIKKLAKIIKREKRKKRLLRKAKLDLTPPPGVDLDEFLLQQVESIKHRLRNEMDSASNVPSTSNLDGVSDLIKDQLDAEGKEERDLGSISNVLHCGNNEQSRRKVVDFKIVGKEACKDLSQTEEGEILDSPEDSRQGPQWFTYLPCKDSVVKNDVHRYSKLDEKSVTPRIEGYDSRQLERLSGNTGSNSTSVITSVDELTLKIDSPLTSHNKLAVDMRINESTFNQKSPKRSAKARSKSPLSYSRRRFRESSPSSSYRRNDRYSPSRSKLSSPTRTRRSSYYRQRLDTPRSPVRRKRRSRSITPKRSPLKRHRSRTKSPIRSSYRRRYGSRSPSPRRSFNHRRYRTKSRSPSPKSLKNLRSSNEVKAPHQFSNKEKIISENNKPKATEFQNDAHLSVEKGKSMNSRSPKMDNHEFRRDLFQETTRHQSSYKSSYPRYGNDRYHRFNDSHSPISLESISPELTIVKPTSEGSPISDNDIEEISTETITTFVEESITYTKV